MTTPKDNNHPHSIYGASGSSTWRNCPGAVRVVQEAKARGDIPEEKSDEYSEKGTAAHDWATKVLTGEITMGEVPDEFREHLEGYVAHCREVEKKAIACFDENGGKAPIVLNERTVPLFYRPQDVGTVDHAVICPEFLEITDLKYGVGVKVDAEENDQGQIYAISLIEDLEVMSGHSFSDDTPVNITIYQPRHFSFNGEPETWEVTVGFLREAAKHIEKDYRFSWACNKKDLGEGVDFNNTENPALNPSDKACMFCDAKGVCRARAKTGFGGMPAELDIEADFDFEGDTKPDLPAFKDYDRETLTPGQIAHICRNGSTIKKIVDDVIKAETERLTAGGEVRQMKLIKGKLGNRVWRDEKEAEKVVRNIFSAADSYKPRKLLTAPQVLAKVKPMLAELSTIAKLRLGLTDEATAARSKTECLIHRPEGQPKLVSADDKAEALIFTTLADNFDIEDENDISDMM